MFNNICLYLSCLAKEIHEVNHKLAVQEGPVGTNGQGIGQGAGWVHISPGGVQWGAGSVGDQAGEAGSANQDVPIP